MRKFLTGLLLLSLLAGAGIGYGLPTYAERQARLTLDAWFAALPAGRDGGYDGLKLDFWNNRLTISRLWGAMPPLLAGNAAGNLNVFLSGVAIEGYSLQALREFQATGTTELPAAQEIRWDELQVRRLDDNVEVLHGGPGRMTSVPVPRAGNPLGGLVQQDLRTVAAAPDLDGYHVGIGIDRLGLSDVSFGRIGGMEVDGLQLRAHTMADAMADDGSGAGPLVTEVRLGRARLEAVTLGAVTEVSGARLEDFLVRTARPGASNNTANNTGNNTGDRAGNGVATDGGTDAATAGAEAAGDREPGPEGVSEGALAFEFSVASADYRNVRLDPQLPDMATGLLESLRDVTATDSAGRDGSGIGALLAPSAEILLTMLERTGKLDLGAGATTLVNYRVQIPGLQEISLARIEASGYGLKDVCAEVRDLRTVDSNGVVTRIGREMVENIDLSAVPGWLRSLTGRPVQADFLIRISDHFRRKTLREGLPPFDFGHMAFHDMVVEQPGLPPVRLAHSKSEGPTVTATGQWRYRLAFDGVSIPAELAGENSRVAEFQGILGRRPQDPIVLGMDVALALDLSTKTGDVDLALDFADAGKARLGLRLSDLDVEAMRRSPPGESRIVAMRTLLTGASLSVTDLGLLGAILAQKAAERPGATVEMMAEQFAFLARRMGEQMGTPSARALGEIAGQFVTGGGSLNLDVAPKRPLPVVGLLSLQRQSPAAIIDLLGLSAEYQAPAEK